MDSQFDFNSVPPKLAERLGPILVAGETVSFGSVCAHTLLRWTEVALVTNERFIQLSFSGLDFARPPDTTKSIALSSISRVEAGRDSLLIWANGAEFGTGVNTGSAAATHAFHQALTAAMKRTATSGDEVSFRLERLQRLKEQALISDEEYNRKRSELMKLL